MKPIAFIFIILLSFTFANAGQQNLATPNEEVKIAAEEKMTDEKKKDVEKEKNVPVTKGKITIPPEKAKPLTIARFEKAPVIDGNLDDAWTGATLFKDFVQIQPGDNLDPSKPTEVFMGYDAKTLYVAFRAYDEQGKVRATVPKRDQIFQDDYVGFYLDTFNDQRKAFAAFFSPLGVQADATYTEQQGEDYSVDVVMESKGALTEDGFIVEVAIPFKSIRYEAGKGKLWGVQLFRRIKRLNNELDAWMPMSRDISGTLNQAGKITGLENISTERTLEIIPTLTLSESGKRVPVVANVGSTGTPEYDVVNGRFVNNPAKVDIGASIKYSLTPTITLDAAINPDFADVEADAPIVQANQRFPVFFSEKRPFFLEGIDIFQTEMSNLDTRTIVDPDFATKLTGKRGRNSFGFFLASDNAPGNFSKEERDDPRNENEIEKFGDKNAYVGVFRLKRDVGREHSIGATFTSYNFIEKHNQLLSFDARFKLDKQTTLQAQVTGTTSKNFFYNPDIDDSEYRVGNAFGYVVSLSRDTRHFFIQTTAVGRTRDFRADVGFVPRKNTNHQGLFAQYKSEPNSKGTLISWNIGSDNLIRYDWQGRIQRWNSGARAFFNFKRNTSIGFGYDNYYEKVYEDEFGARRNANQSGEFFGSPERSAYNKSIFFGGESNPTKKVSFSVYTNYNIGALDFDFGGGPKFPRVSPAALALGKDAPQDPGPANGVSIDSFVTYKPIDKWNMMLNYTKSSLTRQDTEKTAFDANIFSLRSTYQFTRFAFARARIDYDSLSSNFRGQFLLGWTPNPGTALYAGYNDNVNYNGFDNFTDRYTPRLQRNGRTFFIKMSYLIRKSF